jgi:hypothetical protein
MEDRRTYYGQALQDAFVLGLCRMANERYTYLDLGAGHPKHGSNTFALEDCGWKGIVADIATRDQLKAERNAKVFGDAFDPEVDEAILDLAGPSGIIDYLSLDLEPPELTLKRLCSLPLWSIRFGIITCEHDLYRDRGGSIKAAMEGILTHYGYKRVAENVRMIGEDDGKTMLFPVEDWWIHPADHDYLYAWSVANEVLDRLTEQQLNLIERSRAK